MDTMNNSLNSRRFLILTQDKVVLLLYWAAVVPWAFDSQSDSTGQGLIYQLPILVLSFFFFGACHLFIRSRTSFLRACPSFVVSVAWFLVVGIIIGFFNGQEIYTLLANSVPTILYLLFAFLTFKVASTCSDTDAVLHALIQLCLVFGVVCLAISYNKQGLDLETSRYEITSGAVVASLGLISVFLFSRIRVLSLVTVGFAVFSVLLSVTRTLILVTMVQLFCTAVCCPRILLVKRNLGVAVFGAAMLLGVTAWGLTTGSTIFERWLTRMTPGKDYDGEDPTYLMRVAEVDFMKQGFWSTPFTICFGNGIAARTELIGEASMVAGAYFGSETMEYHGYRFGHNNHWSLLFIGGVCAGLPLLVNRFATLLWGFLDLRRIDLDESPPSVDIAGLWGTVIVVGMVVSGFLGPTMSMRGICLWYGIGTGLLLWSHSMKNSTASNLDYEDTADR
jgi:hypothetical protein